MASHAHRYGMVELHMCYCISSFYPIFLLTLPPRLPTITVILQYLTISQLSPNSLGPHQSSLLQTSNHALVRSVSTFKRTHTSPFLQLSGFRELYHSTSTYYLPTYLPTS
jgi:hypothetical protein